MTRPALTVYFDGSCPVCRAEIGFYRRQIGADQVHFVDVSTPSAEPGADLPRRDAMRRLHVRLPTSELRSGGAAFVEIWNVLPMWRPAAIVARLPGAASALELGYRVTQPLRPVFARALRHVV